MKTKNILMVCIIIVTMCITICMGCGSANVSAKIQFSQLTSPHTTEEETHVSHGSWYNSSIPVVYECTTWDECTQCGAIENYRVYTVDGYY